jgi:ABC-type multidrug transport system fused ATPase/permease subunit
LPIDWRKRVRSNAGYVGWNLYSYIRPILSVPNASSFPRLASGVAFAAQGVSQFGNFSEAFTLARVAAYDALKVMNRAPGSPEVTVYSTSEDDELNSTAHSKRSKEDKEPATPVVKAILPKYEIDSTSDAGVKPKDLQGHLKFNDVVFAYPTRPNETVLKGLTTEIVPGQTVAFVGPRYARRPMVVRRLRGD